MPLFIPQVTVAEFFNVIMVPGTTRQSRRRVVRTPSPPLPPRFVNDYGARDSPPPGSEVRDTPPVDSDDDSLGGASILISHVSSAASTLTSVPTFESEWSTRARASNAVPAPHNPFKYDDIVWARLPGYMKPITGATSLLHSPIWRQGIPIECQADTKRYWLCTECHKGKATKKHCFDVKGGTCNILNHIRNIHGLTPDPNNKKELVPVTDITARVVIDQLDANDVRDQAILNDLAASFDHRNFRRLLTRWMVLDDIPFRQVDGEAFREWVKYINPRAEQAMPSQKTVRKWIMEDYKVYKEMVKKDIAKSLTKVHIAFDLWTSGNCLSLNGIVAHYINSNWEAKTILLATPEQSDSHSGINIAEEVLKILKEFGLVGTKSRVGWFVLDNASNNDTAMDDLCEKLDLNSLERRLRCAGHIINLIARHLLYGFDKKLFDEADSSPVEMREELKRWRCAGPVGRAHNLVTWVYASPQRKARWHQCKCTVLIFVVLSNCGLLPAPASEATVAQLTALGIAPPSSSSSSNTFYLRST